MYPKVLNITHQQARTAIHALKPPSGKAGGFGGTFSSSPGNSFSILLDIVVEKIKSNQDELYDLFFIEIYHRKQSTSAASNLKIYKTSVLMTISGLRRSSPKVVDMPSRGRGLAFQPDDSSF